MSVRGGSLKVAKCGNVSFDRSKLTRKPGQLAILASGEERLDCSSVLCRQHALDP